MTVKHEDRCPSCGRFVDHDGDGFYDAEDRTDDASTMLQFCDEPCADRYAKAKGEDS